MTQEITKVKNKRNYCLGFFQGLACILIIFMHAKFPGEFGLAIESLARFGVPLFFMVSGYYLISENSSLEEVRAKLKKRIFKILIIYLIAATLQDIFSLIGAAQLGATKEWFLEIFSWQNILYFIFCNRPFVCVAYWFLLAMINAYIILYIFARHFINKKILPIIFATLAIVVISFRTCVLAFDININGYSLANGDLYHTWYANGLIFMCFGIILRRYTDKLLFVPSWALLLTIFIGLFAMVGEGFLYNHLFGRGLAYYIFSVVTASSMIVLSLKHPLRFSKFIFAKFPDDWTMLVYVLHPGIIFAVEYALQAHMPKDVFAWTYPLIVMILTVLVAVLIAILLKLIKNIRKQKQE